MTYVIRRTDQGGGWVTPPGSRSSYTRSLQYAATWVTKEDAERERCPDNEVVEAVRDIWDHRQGPRGEA